MFDFQKIYDNWNWERLQRHLAYWLLWLFLYAAANTGNSDVPFITWIKLELIVMIVKVPYVYFLIYFLVPRFLIKKQIHSFFIYAIIVGFIGGVFTWLLYFNIIYPSMLQLDPNQLTYKKAIWKSLDLINTAMIPVVIKLMQHQFLQEKQTRNLLGEKLNAELQLLKNQLQPHFLFNTLNNLYGMILVNDSKSAELVLKLSSLMSYMLYECEQASVSLVKEIEQLQNYLELEKVRHSERLDLDFEIQGIIQHQHIAPLLLLPFVENAFKHGAEKVEGLVKIKILLIVEEAQIKFQVENTYTPNNTSSGTVLQSGIGLKNVQKRLKLLYPNRHELTIHANALFHIQLKINL